MFTSSRNNNKSYRESFSYRAGKATSTKKKDPSFKTKDYSQSRRISVPQPQQSSPTRSQAASSSAPTSPHLNSAIVTISVGPNQRLFAAHEDILSKSTSLNNHIRAQFFSSPGGKRIELPNEEPEIFSAVLEFLYKGDYSPKLVYDKKRSSWYLDSDDNGGGESTIHHGSLGGPVLKDTVIYCAANTYALPTLQRLALKKQGLQSGVQCSTILSSARFAYAHTPASDSKLRAHYLALIIRSRDTFKRSGTMQLEMQNGGTPLFFDLFVAMVNHLDDITSAKSPR